MRHGDKKMLAVRFSLLAAALVAACVLYFAPYFNYLALNAAYADCKSIENVIDHGGKPKSDIELLIQLSRFAFYEPDRTHFLQLAEHWERGDLELLRKSKRDIFTVVCASRESAVAYCVIPPRVTDWSCSAELHVDADSSEVSLMVCGNYETQITTLEGYAVLLHGGIVRIPQCETTACLARFLLDGQSK